MATKPKFGLYWGKKGFGFVETKDKQITHCAYIPFDAPLGTANDSDVPDELKYGALIQKTIQANKIQSKQVNLSLSDKDFIFRSFVIPWMQSHEVKNVVDFEATKYIPIPLDNLSYAFHPQTIIENKQKSLLILFFAARKDITQNYVQLLQNSGIDVIHIEPSPVSLVRVLQKHGIIVRNHSNAIIVIDQGEGKIIIVEQDTVQFVRDFQISEKPGDITSDSTKIFNNIRVSFNFFYRQNPGGKINNIILLSLQEFPNFTDAISKEFDKPVTCITASQILKNNDIQNIDVLNAYGIALRDPAYSSKNFELGEKAKLLQKTGEATLIKFHQYRMMAVTAISSLLFIYLVNLLGNHLITGYHKRLAELEGKQGNFSSLQTADIISQEQELSTKLQDYKDIRLHSDMKFFLRYIPGILPQGVWLNKLTIQYSQLTLETGEGRRTLSKPIIVLEGFAYHRDPNEQFRLVTNLVALLKNSTEFSKSFQGIDRENMQQTNFSNYPVTSFRITCK